MAIKKARHPGEIIRERYLRPQGLTVTEAAKRLNVSRQTLNNLLNGKAGISSKMKDRLTETFGEPPETWEQMQRDYDSSRRGSGRQPMWVSSRDIAQWANTKEAAYVLPELVRRLVHETGDGIKRFNFPGGEDVQRRGFDGLLECATATHFVPGGSSVWELSKQQTPRVKAEIDYAKRSPEPIDLEPSETTFVVVTARAWLGKADWAAEKNREGTWAEVRVYDSSDLEQWLELAPGVAIWFATKIGRRPERVQSLEGFWNEFRRGTAPPISGALVLTGRTAEAEKLGNWLHEGSGVFRLLADSSDEALAFLAGTTLQMPEQVRAEVLANMVVVGGAEEARHLSGVRERLTLCWRFDDTSLLGSVVAEGHRVLLPLARDAAVVQTLDLRRPGTEEAGGQTQLPDLELPRLGRKEFVEALKNSLPAEANEKKDDEASRSAADKRKQKEAEQRASRTGRSLTVYRRLYCSAGVAKPPEWACPGEAGQLIPLLLAGGWSESNEADTAAVSELAGIDYSDVSRTLAHWKNRPDAPFRRIGDTWILAALLDSWSLLARFVTDIDIARFEKIVKRVLGADDPALELAPEQRWLANIRGKKFEHSGALRRGLADSLVLLGVLADDAGLQASYPATELVQGVVSSLLTSQPGVRRWASLAGLLPALAEAAPEAFLSALETSLKEDTPEVLDLFQGEDRPLGGGGRHPNLLWALETLAWYPEHLSRVAKALAKLARVAPQGRLVNRPSKSLREIFCTWHPNTSASLDERLQVLDMLLQWEPDAAWQLLVELLPKDHDVSQNNAAPRWRAKTDRGLLTYGEVWRAKDEVVGRALKAAELDGGRLATLLPEMRAWAPEERLRLRQRLREFSSLCQDDDQRTRLWQATRSLLARNRRHPDADWSLAEDELVQIEAVWKLLEPDDLLERYAWLFDDDMPDLPRSKGSSFDESENEVSQARGEALSAIMNARGLEGVFAMAQRAKRPGYVGYALAKLVTEPGLEREILQRTLACDEANVRILGLAYVDGLQRSRGDAWAEKIVGSALFEGWSEEKKADFCLGLAPVTATWAIVEELGGNVQERYWSRTTAFLTGKDSADKAEYVLGRLLGAGREFEALDEASSHPEKFRTTTLVRVLKATSEKLEKLKKGDHTPSGLDHDLERVFSYLRNRPDMEVEDLAGLEWFYLPLLHPFQQPVTLHRFLQSSSQFFADVVVCVFRPDGEEAESSSQEELPDELVQNRARVAWDLLDSWKSVPGKQEDGTLDGEHLTRWFREARSLCADQKRSSIGDLQIGKVLAHAPSGSDGVWPHPDVRDLIEEAESRGLEEGISTGVHNKGGAIWRSRSPFAGGQQERAEARQYRAYAESVEMRWPNTGRVLRAIARTYEALGKREDQEAEKLDLHQ